jgi:hypothetical protein
MTLIFGYNNILARAAARCRWLLVSIVGLTNHKVDEARASRFVNA